MQIHKIMAGLLDTYLFMSDDLALQMVIDEAKFFQAWIEGVIESKGYDHWVTMLDVEFGGMAEVLYNLYSTTNDTNHLK